MFYHAAKLQKTFQSYKKKYRIFLTFLTCQLKKRVFSYKYDHFCDFQANKTTKYTLMFK